MKRVRFDLYEVNINDDRGLSLDDDEEVVGVFTLEQGDGDPHVMVVTMYPNDGRK